MKLLVFSVTFFSIVLAGCTSLQPIDSRSYGNIDSNVQVGDTVQIETLNGKKMRFKVTAIGGNVIKGKKHEVAYENIALIGTREFHMWKTIGMAALIVGLGAAASNDSGGGGYGGGGGGSGGSDNPYD
jgi:hypothetical protein